MDIECEQCGLGGADGKLGGCQAVWRGDLEEESRQPLVKGGRVPGELPVPVRGASSPFQVGSMFVNMCQQERRRKKKTKVPRQMRRLASWSATKSLADFGLRACHVP